MVVDNAGVGEFNVDGVFKKVMKCFDNPSMPVRLLLV